MKTLSEKEIIKIIEKNLPKIIEKHPEVRRKIEEILEKKAATKDDIKAILFELRKQREELIKQREELMKQREETNKRFEEINKRFEEINKRFENLEKDINKRFEEINKRFEEINRRFEEINKRFEEINKRFENLERNTNRRFEEINKRFEKLEFHMFEGFKRMERTISAIGTRWGYGAEEAFRSGFEDVLSEIGYKVIKWRKMDEKGEFFLSRREGEIDIVIKNKEKIAIEVKSSLSMSEVEDFERCVRFYEKEEGEKITKKIIVAIYPRKGTVEYARKFKIKVIKGLEEGEEYFRSL